MSSNNSAEETPLNREEDLVLKSIIHQGVASGKISKNRDFDSELLHAIQQKELLGDLPKSSGEALLNLNRLLSAFPTYSGPYRMVRAAQAMVSTIHAKTMAFAETLDIQKKQARVAVLVMQEVNAKTEANRLKERERRQRQRQRELVQSSITSHLIRGPLPRGGPLPGPPPLKESRRPASRTFKTSTPAQQPPPVKQEVIILSSDSSEGAPTAVKKSKPRRSPRFDTEDNAGDNQIDGAASTRSEPTPSPSPSPKMTAIDFFTDILGNTVSEAVREVEILREQARRDQEVEEAKGHSAAGELRAERSDQQEYPMDLTIQTHFT